MASELPTSTSTTKTGTSSVAGKIFACAVVVLLCAAVVYTIAPKSAFSDPTAPLQTTKTKTAAVERDEVIMATSEPFEPSSSPSSRRAEMPSAKKQYRTKFDARGPCMSRLEPFPKWYRPYIAPYKNVGHAQSHSRRIDADGICPELMSQYFTAERPPKRRVFIDLGANRYRTSTWAFQMWHPLGKTNFTYYAFEPLDFGESYKECGQTCRYFRAVLGQENGFLSFISRSTGQADSFNAVFHSKANGRPKNAIFTVPMYDIAQWLNENINDAEDYVVLKMDIEFGEWNLIPYMQRTGVFRKIDEFYFECHHRQMSERYASKSHDDCNNVMLDVRKNDHVASHIWYL
eukprot:PhM_4_TR6987/c0_g1_i1/m.69263